MLTDFNESTNMPYDLQVTKPCYWLLLLSALMCTCMMGVAAKDCVTRDRCSCIFDDGSGMVDIRGIGNKDGTPLFPDYPATSGTDLFMYSYNPCYPFQEGTCTNTAVCQYGTEFDMYYDAGSADLATYTFDGTHVAVHYSSQDGARQSVVTLQCDLAQPSPLLEVTGETTPSVYYMKMTGAAACPVPIPDNGESGGLSAGSVMLIILFVLLTVYIIVGFLYKRFRHQSSGKEMIPNRNFWTGLPSLIRDGAAFTTGLICRRRSVYVSVP